MPDDISLAMEMRGKKWKYAAYYIGAPHENSVLLAKMENGGWEVINITGTDEGNDVIWFRRPANKEVK